MKYLCRQVPLAQLTAALASCFADVLTLGAHRFNKVARVRGCTAPQKPPLQPPQMITTSKQEMTVQEMRPGGEAKLLGGPGPGMTQSRTLRT